MRDQLEWRQDRRPTPSTTSPAAIWRSARSYSLAQGRDVKTEYRARATSRAFYAPRNLSGRSSWLEGEPLLVLFRRDLPGVETTLGRRGGRPPQGELANDAMERAAAVTDHKGVL